MAVNREELLELLNILEELEDEVDYSPSIYKPSKNIVVLREEVLKELVDNDEEEGEIIKIIRSYIRKTTSISVDALKKAFEPVEIKPDIKNKEERKSLNKSNKIEKSFNYNDFARWRRELGRELDGIDQTFEDRLFIPISATYGKGYRRGMKDLGIKPNNNWMFLDGSYVPRLRAVNILQHLRSNLEIEMQTAIVDGMRHGEGIDKIAKRIRDVNSNPKHVTVPELRDPKTGDVLRRGFEYDIPNRRYSEIVARTNVMAATNEGRLDSYEQSRVVATVEWMTAGDNRVCDICEPRDGEIFTLEEARGLLPVHAMCRCTYAIDKYVDEVPSKEEIAEAYEYDEMDAAVNTAPVGLSTEDELKAHLGLMRYKAHLAAHGLDNPNGYQAAYKKIAASIKKLNVDKVEGFAPGRLEHTYALHQMKNTRLLLNRATKGGLHKTDYIYMKEPSDQMLQFLGYPKTKWSQARKQLMGVNSGSATSYETKTTIFQKSLSPEKFPHTISHETGHTIERALSVPKTTEWHALHRTSKERITAYATTSPTENFAESYSYYMLQPDKLRTSCPQIYKWMEKNIDKRADIPI